MAGGVFIVAVLLSLCLGGSLCVASTKDCDTLDVENTGESVYSKNEEQERKIMTSLCGKSRNDSDRVSSIPPVSSVAHENTTDNPSSSPPPMSPVAPENTTDNPSPSPLPMSSGVSGNRSPSYQAVPPAPENPAAPEKLSWAVIAVVSGVLLLVHVMAGYGMVSLWRRQRKRSSQLYYVRI